MTSKWVRMVAEQRDYDVDWRFISLRMINAHIDYDAHFPPEYEAGHTAGLKLLRVAARAQGRTWARTPSDRCTWRWDGGSSTRHPTIDRPPEAEQGSRSFLEPILAEAGLPAELADALEDSLVRRRTPCGDGRGAWR